MAIHITTTQQKYPIPSLKIKKLIRLISKTESKKELESLSIIFLGNTAMKRMNRNFLNHDYVTDVLSFDLSSAETIDGEIYIGIDKAAAQAREYRVSLTNEILRLTAHGFLHILGYDDDTDNKRTRMLELGDHFILMLKKR